MRKYLYEVFVIVLVGLNAVLVLWRRLGGRRPVASPTTAAPEATTPAQFTAPQPVPPSVVNARTSELPVPDDSPAPESLGTSPSVPPPPLPKRQLSLDTSLFLLALLVFLLTRLIGLEQWPIYFFSDEANQTVQAANLFNNGFRDRVGLLFPTYFQNGFYFNLSVSVYTQVLPYVLFGYSVFVTRAVSVLFALSGAAAVGLTLKHIFAARWDRCKSIAC